MLVYTLLIVGLLIVVAAVWFLVRASRGDVPPSDVQSEDPPPPDDRDTAWDPRQRYDDPHS